MLCEKIEAQGVRTFRDDRDIDGGDDIPDRIREEIIRSQEILVVLTPDSVDRPWVLLEVGAGWGRRQSYRITAVLCHVEYDTIPDMIKSKKAISINEVDDYLAQLKKRARTK
jgi:TIR domain